MTISLTKEIKGYVNDPHDFNLVGRDIAYYMQGLEFESRTLYFSTLCEI